MTKHQLANMTSQLEIALFCQKFNIPEKDFYWYSWFAGFKSLIEFDDAYMNRTIGDAKLIDIRKKALKFVRELDEK